MYYYTGNPIKLLNYLHTLLKYFGYDSDIFEENSEDIVVKCTSFDTHKEWTYSISYCVYNSQVKDFVRCIKISRYDEDREHITSIYLDKIPSNPHVIIDERDWMKLVLFFMIPSLVYEKILSLYSIESRLVGDYKSSDSLIRHIKISMADI